MKKIAQIGLLSLLIMVAGCSQGKETVKQANTAQKIENKQTVDAFGLVKSLDNKNIIIDFPSKIEKVHVKEGQKVNLAETLVTMDISDYIADIKNKENDLDVLKKEIERTNNELDRKTNYMKSNSNPDLKKLYNNLKNAEDLYNQALDELNDKALLSKEGTISQYEFNSFKKTLDAKKKDVEDARISCDSLKESMQKDIDQLKTSLEKSLGKVVTLESEIKQMNGKLQKNYIKQNEIVSDVQNSVVYEIGYVQGDIVTPERNVLKISGLDNLIVEADINEEFIKDVKLGADVEIYPVSDKSKQYKGKVVYMPNNAVEKNGETVVRMQISIDNKDSFLIPNMNVDIKISIN